MKRFFFFVRCLLLFNSIALAQLGDKEGNPFAQYGYKAKIGTASGGRFPEYHDLEDVVQIGAVLFDTQAKQMVGEAPPDTLPKLPAQVTSMWMGIDPLAEKYYHISPYVFCANNPIRFIDPDGRDIWEIDRKGYITWIEKSDDHRLYSLNEEGTRSDNYITVENRNILDKLDGKNKFSFYTADKNGYNDVFNVFKFAADNTNVEWIVYNSKSGNFTLGTKHNNDNAGNWEDYGIKETPIASVHSHPGIRTEIREEEYSMGYQRIGNNQANVLTESDLYNVRKDVNDNGSQTRLNYVYFPNSKRLYHVNYTGPIFIRSIGDNYRRFFLGPFK